ncbi:ncsA [Acrasis kona]|uniref:NcsA n=1 Tax=Acrasis kona TaxID=1008807 RepID=A0AAW2Z5T6_9EUKA
MGQTTSNNTINIEKHELEHLATITHYDRKEIRQMHKQYYEEVPKGFIPKSDFGQLTELMGIKDPFISSLVFNAFDTNSDGQISFEEFIVGMSVMTRGNADEKLDFAFKLYDLDSDGFITRNDMLQIVGALYRMLGDLVSLQGEDYDAPTKLVNKIFLEMDADKDDMLSREEYKIGAKNDPSIVQGLCLF